MRIQVAPIVQRLIQKGLTIGVVESLTGGGILETLTRVPGASKAVIGGLVTYTNELKMKLLQLPSDQFPKEGAVSAAMVSLMVRQGLLILPANIVVAVSGNAGPSAMDHQPVGKVFIGIGLRDQWVKINEYDFQGTRSQIRRATIAHVLRSVEDVLS